MGFKRIMENVNMQLEIEEAGKRAGLPIREDDCVLIDTCEGLEDCQSGIIKGKVYCPYVGGQE